MKMAGFPETTFEYWAGKFLERGFKVARVDQNENMISKNMREKEDKSRNRQAATGSVRKDKIIERELKEIITIGTPYDHGHLKNGDPVFLGVFLNEGSNQEKSTHILLYEAATNQIFLKTLHAPTDDYVSTILVQYDVREIITNMQTLKISHSERNIILIDDSRRPKTKNTNFNH
ncbi:DNA mismatch repair protein MSH6, partial [Dictyocoela roeselum]